MHYEEGVGLFLSFFLFSTVLKEEEELEGGEGVCLYVWVPRQ